MAAAIEAESQVTVGPKPELPATLEARRFTPAMAVSLGIFVLGGIGFTAGLVTGNEPLRQVGGGVAVMGAEGTLISAMCC